jgi:hypothetical protein
LVTTRLASDELDGFIKAYLMMSGGDREEE